MGAHISVPMYQRALGQRYRLSGAKCRNCSAIIFPPKAVCPYCLESWDFDPKELSGRGEVYTYTIISGRGALPEFSRQSRIQGSFPVAVIKLIEGPHIIGQLVNIERQEIHVGLEVYMVFRHIYEEEGVIRYGYKFRPKV